MGGPWSSARHERGWVKGLELKRVSHMATRYGGDFNAFFNVFHELHVRFSFSNPSALNLQEPDHILHV